MIRLKLGARFINADSILDHDKLSQHYLNILYQRVEERHIHNKPKNNNIAETYGEILYPSVSKLLALCNLTQDDIFVDLGSGIGQIVMQAFLTSSAKEVYGIEISPSLHEKAMLANEIMLNELMEFHDKERKLFFLCDSFFDASFTNATVVMLNSTCFNQEMLFALGRIIERSSVVRLVLSTRPIGSFERLVFKKSVRIECSWNTEMCYVYEVEYNG